MSLLLLTGAAGMVVGAGGLPPPGRIATTMLGLALACGGAGAFNHVIDRDIDRLMGSRTSARPVAAGRIPAAQALEFGLALSAASFALLASSVNVLTALLALAGNLFYVFVYTSWLKRRSRHNIVIGGVAGAIPPLVGYAGATGHLGLAAVMLFAIVVVWTPPHFWALALLLRRQYAEAGIPMLPVVAGERETTRQIIAYTVVLVGVSALPFAVAGLRPRLPRVGACPGSDLPRPRASSAPGYHAETRERPLPLLVALPRAPVHGCCRLRRIGDAPSVAARARS